MLGNFLALASAVTWAMTTVAMRPVLGRAGVGRANTVRFIVCASLFLVLAAIGGRLMPMFALPSGVYLVLLLSAVSSLIVGDCAYFLASRRMGVSRALPISMSYPLLTALAAVIWLGEQASWTMWFGAMLVVGGATLLSLADKRKVKASGSEAGGERQIWSVALAVVGAVGWALSVLLLKLALAQTDPFSMNVIRMCFGAVLSLAFAQAVPGIAGAWPRGRLLLLAGGVGVGTLVSSVIFVEALNLAGAARVSIINGAAPLFALPIARIFLAEPITKRTLLGVVATVAGVVMVVIR